MAAKVVDLPQPVGPVTKTKPWRASSNLVISMGMPKSSKVGSSSLITRATIQILLFSKEKFKRKR